jgi:hypothetical protein
MFFILIEFYEIAEEPDFGPPFIRKWWTGQNCFLVLSRPPLFLFFLNKLQELFCLFKGMLSGLV